MKTYFLVFIFFIIGTSKLMSQTYDVAISYVLREVQIHLAKEYNKELARSLPKFTQYALKSAIFYKTTKITSKKSSSFLVTFPTNPCWDPLNPLKMPLNPLKVTRCRKKIDLLRSAYSLVRKTPLLTTSYTSKSAVQSNIMVKTNSILRDINTELLQH